MHPQPTAAGVRVDNIESKFTKSKSNRGTENAARAVLLSDARFQYVDGLTKLRILESLPVTGAFGVQTFDLVMTPDPVEPITVANVDRFATDLRLIELKSTRKSIRNSDLNGFFFGATEREYTMAAALGDRYLFAFVVLSSANDYGRPFVVLLSLEQVEQRTRAKRKQFQVNFRADTASGAFEGLVLGPVPLEADLGGGPGPYTPSR